MSKFILNAGVIKTQEYTDKKSGQVKSFDKIFFFVPKEAVAHLKDEDGNSLIKLNSLNDDKTGYVLSTPLSKWGVGVTSHNVTEKSFYIDDNGYLAVRLMTLDELAKVQMQKKVQEQEAEQQADFLIKVAKKAEEQGVSTTVVSTIVQETAKSRFAKIRDNAKTVPFHNIEEEEPTESVK